MNETLSYTPARVLNYVAPTQSRDQNIGREITSHYSVLTRIISVLIQCGFLDLVVLA